MTNQADVIAATLIAHLKNNGQISLLGDVVNVLLKSSEYKNSKNHVVISSAVTLDPSELKGINEYLGKTLGSGYELIEVVDPSLVGGFTLQINDTFIDASILGKINAVSNKLIAKD